MTVPAAIRAITKIASAGHPRIYFRILANVKASTAVVSVLLILCSTGSCSTITGEDQTALDLFEQLCQAEGGSQAFGKAHDVSGIFMNTWSGQCRRCSTVLRASGYQFVEFRFTGSPPEFPGSFVKAPGLYRMSLKPKGHPDCETFYQRYKYEMEQGRIEVVHRRYGGKCIAVERINSISATYEFMDRRYEKYKYDQIEKFETIFKNRTSNHIYARVVNFKYTPKNTKIDFFTQAPKGQRQCFLKLPPSPSEIFLATENKID